METAVPGGIADFRSRHSLIESAERCIFTRHCALVEYNLSIGQVPYQYVHVFGCKARAAEASRSVLDFHPAAFSPVLAAYYFQ